MREDRNRGIDADGSANHPLGVVQAMDAPHLPALPHRKGVETLPRVTALLHVGMYTKRVAEEVHVVSDRACFPHYAFTGFPVSAYQCAGTGHTVKVVVLVNESPAFFITLCFSALVPRLMPFNTGHVHTSWSVIVGARCVLLCTNGHETRYSVE